MADRIYLSCWLRGFTAHNMLASFEKLLGRFPFSRLAPEATLQIHAIDLTQAPVLEHFFEQGVDAAEVVRLCREFEHPDSAYRLEANWDLMTFNGGWRLAPAPVAITCFGPLFPSDLGEQILYDFGFDSPFLPQPGRPGDLAPVRSNIRSLLRLVDDVRAAVPLDKRTLWSESGASLAGELETALRSEIE